MERSANPGRPDARPVLPSRSPTPGPPRIQVDLRLQQLSLYRGEALLEVMSVSTAAQGPGELNGSGGTPRGLHRIRLKVGEGCPSGAVFRARRWTGEVYSIALAATAPRRDWILSRILWLTGCEPGRNRGGAVDTLRRYIYIHGCPETEPMGVARSHGCIRMRNADVIRLCERIPVGCPVLIR